MPDSTPEPNNPKWLLLIHQIPPKPDYFRVKVWRRLQRLGAVPLKNSVYVLPRNDQAMEDFQWMAREIVSGKGDATVCEARFVEGLTDKQVESLFHQARNADYEAIAEDARRLTNEVPRSRKAAADQRARVESDLARLRKRLADIAAIDHLRAPAAATARRHIEELERMVHTPVSTRNPEPRDAGPVLKNAYRRRTWVTRRGIHIDRMASAWLIRRFIDHAARFKFVPPAAYRPGKREVRFDMFEAEFTHEGDLCTFEVLIKRFSLHDPALRPIAEIVHDIDLKDARWGRQEGPGIERLIAGIAMAHRDDGRRLERGAAVFEDLYEYFRRRRA